MAQQINNKKWWEERNRYKFIADMERFQKPATRQEELREKAKDPHFWDKYRDEVFKEIFKKQVRKEKIRVFFTKIVIPLAATIMVLWGLCLIYSMSGCILCKL